jgi:replicative DNA helicase
MGLEKGWQMAMVTRALEIGDLQTVKLYGIGPDDLTDSQASIALRYVQAHVDKHGHIPKLETIQFMLPGAEFVPNNESMDVLCEHVAEELTEIKYNQIIASASQLDGLKIGPSEAARNLHQQMLDLSNRYGRKALYTMGSRADLDYAEIAEEEDMDVVASYCWGPLQEETGGLRMGDLVIIWGRRKCTKTFRLLQLAEHTDRHDEVPGLILTPEMTSKQISRRLYAIRGRFNYRGLKNKRLFSIGDEESVENKMHLARTISSFESNRLKIYDPMDEDGTLNMELVEGLVKEYQPKVLYVDQLQYISQGGDWESKPRHHQLGQNCKKLKKLARQARIGVVATTQANRENMVAESDQIEQIADLSIHLKFYKKLGVICCEVECARELELERWYCFSKFCENMGDVPANDPIIKRIEEAQREEEHPKKGRTKRSEDNGPDMSSEQGKIRR